MSNHPCPRLIEVALPIQEISAESVRDKSLRHGHISTLHLWWARRPLAASRAVVFASLVPDPDDPRCPADFLEAVERHLKTHVPTELKYYLQGAAESIVTTTRTDLTSGCRTRCETASHVHRQVVAGGAGLRSGEGEERA
jgi:adenine-specific DNA methylase